MSQRSEPMLGFAAATFRARRERVLSSLRGSALVLPAASTAVRSRDAEYRYRADSELFYLTGVAEPGALAVLRPGGHDGDFVLFVRPRDEEAERWSGRRIGPEGAREVFGADRVYDIRDVEKRLPSLLAGADSVLFRLGSGSGIERLVVQALETARLRGARKGAGPRSVVDPGQVLDSLRLVKDPEEVARIRRAASVTVDSFVDLAAAIKPGVGEWELEAVLDGGFRKRGAWGPAYPTIVGSGANALVLHYTSNDRVLQEGDLVLVDAGAEVDLYAADVTRTLPVSGCFSDSQRALYEVVLRANRRAVEAVRPGAAVARVHREACDELIDGLLELGVMEGDKDGVLAAKSYKAFFPHQTSHWLGLDVHDVGDYTFGHESRVLEEGMVLTVEPGLYVGPDALVPDYAGMGVRIEDDVLVTAHGHEVLTSSLPRGAAEIEALMQGGE